jgi:NADH-quinone oxidoreductase subunit A
VPSQYLPLLAAFIVAVVLGVVLLSLAHLAGRSKATGGRVKTSTYESGLPLLDESRKRISVLFFLIAIDFVIFDVEAAFLYPWALVFREGSWPLFAAVMVFVALILVGYAYIWRKGGLDLTPRRGSATDRAGVIVRGEP